MKSLSPTDRANATEWARKNGVERIEFDPEKGQGRVHYRLPLGRGVRFDLGVAARDLGLSPSGVRLASPRGFAAAANAFVLPFEEAA